MTLFDRCSGCMCAADLAALRGDGGDLRDGPAKLLDDRFTVRGVFNQHPPWLVGGDHRHECGALCGVVAAAAELFEKVQVCALAPPRLDDREGCGV